MEVALILLITALLFACTAMSKFTPEQRAEFEKAIAELNTPEKINQLLTKHFIYDSDLYYVSCTNIRRATTIVGWS